MASVGKSRFSRLIDAARRTASLRWGGIGCRVAFFLGLIAILVSALVGLILVREGARTEQQEMQSRALLVGRYAAALAAEPLRRKDRPELERTMRRALLAHDPLAPVTVLSFAVYGRNGAPVLEYAASGAAGLPRTASPPSVADLFSPESMDGGPRILEQESGVFTVHAAIMARDVPVGAVRLTLSGKRSSFPRDVVVKHRLPLFGGIALLGFVFSQVIAAGITRPLARLSTAIEELSRLNWKTPIPVHGNDEVNRLAAAFNQMAMSLNQRDQSLSRGNRDLFILHTAGLDLMESLDLQTVAGKICSRSSDLLRADSTTVSAIDRTGRTLRYIAAEGERAGLLSGDDLPIEAGGIFNWFASHGTPLLIEDAEADMRLDAKHMRALGITSILSAPLWSSNTMIGILTVLNKKDGGRFDRHDLRLFTVFSNLAGAALQNARLYADLKRKIDELHSAQLQLVHSTKMVAVGELATNMAHEINNPLTSVLGYTSHLLKTLDIPDEARNKLRMMEQETIRVRKIIRNLLDFSRPRPAQMQRDDLMRPLQESIALMEGVLERAHVQVVGTYPENPLVIRMDRNELKQVFINIITNALHAMPQGGVLAISAQRSGENQARVEFADDGHGIAPEHLRRIFEPFFSTKHEGIGTGLGLSISHRIVENHGGRIEVSSTPGNGARFRLHFPLADERA